MSESEKENSTFPGCILAARACAEEPFRSPPRPHLVDLTAACSIAAAGPHRLLLAVFAVCAQSLWTPFSRLVITSIGPEQF